MDAQLESAFDKLEIEDQFVLRVPEKQATRMRKMLSKKPRKIAGKLALDLDVEARKGVLQVGSKTLYGKLVDLPTITESYKTTDKAHLFKCGNVTQMLMCTKTPPQELDGDDDNNKSKGEPSLPVIANNSPKNQVNQCQMEADAKKRFAHPHGLTPPLKNVRKCRFRKTLRNPNSTASESEDVEKEVLLLLKADAEAISTRFEILYETETNNNTISQPCKNLCVEEINEKTLFGDTLSDTDTDESAASGLNDIMDFTN